jgi:hypothetical protein
MQRASPKRTNKTVGGIPEEFLLQYILCSVVSGGRSIPRDEHLKQWSSGVAFFRTLESETCKPRENGVSEIVELSMLPTSR